MNKLNTIKAKHDELFAALSSYLDSSDADLKVAQDKENEYNAVKSELDSAIAFESRINGYGTDIKARNDSRTVPAVRFDNSKPEAVKSLGDMFVSTDAYKSYRKGERINTGAEVKANLTRTGLTNYDQLSGIIQIGKAPVGVADLFSQATTGNSVVRFIREQSFANYASPTLEAGLKPLATSNLEQVLCPVEKIAIVEKVSEEMLADNQETASYLNNVLTYSVFATKDNMVLNGSGTSPQILGALNVPGISTLAKAGGDTDIDAIYKAITIVRASGFYQPDHIVMNPLDWQTVRLTKAINGTGDYFFGAPGTAGVDTLWGLPVQLSVFIPQGTALVGAFKVGGTVYTREGVRVEMTNSNENDFITNLIAMRVETRLALAITQVRAFCKITGL